MWIQTSLFVEAFIKYFVVLSPISIIGPFIAITKKLKTEERTRLMNQSILLAYLILVFTLILGKFLLSTLGISTYSLQIAGGILFFKFGFDSMHGKIGEDADEANSPSLVPLAFPIIAGPGSVTVSIVLVDSVEPNFTNIITIIVAVTIAMFVVYLVISNSNTIERVLGERAMTAITVIMGLLVISIGIELILEGFQQWILTLDLKNI